MIKFFFYTSTPFIICFGTFFFLSRLTTQESFPAPQLLGHSIADAIIMLSEKNLHPHILEQREDPTCIPGTIIEQRPEPGQRIKEKQPIFLTVSKAIVPPSAPNFIGIPIKLAKKIAHEQQLHATPYFIDHIAPKNTIIAQYPAAGDSVTNQSITLYISSGKTEEYFIMPNLRGKTFQEAQEIIEEKNLKISSPQEKNSLVVNQKPLPGTIIKQSDAPIIQLQTKG